MRSIINKLLLGTMTVASVACTGNYLDINSNPYQPGDLSADDYALGSAMNNLASCVVSSDVNTAQFTDCLLGGPYGGYFADSNTSWSKTIANFNASDDWTRVFLKSDRIIPILYTNLTAVENLATQTGNQVPLAIAKIIKVAAMSRVTDAYGPIPYTEIGKDGSITTPYDSQEKVYESFFNELTEASQILEQYATENPSARPLKNYDLVYEGDVSKWAKFANTLMLRLAMRVVYVKPDWAQKYAEQAVVKSKLGVMTSNADNALLHSHNGITVYHPLNVVWDMYKDARMGASMESYLKGYKDARISKYFSQATTPAGDYHGMRNGIIVDNIEGYRALSCPNVQKTDPVLWMCAAEAYFLRAEGALRQWNMNGDAKDLYEQGVQTSFEQHSAALGDYLTDDTAKPAKFEDKVGNNSTEPRSTITPVYKTEEEFEANLERIITQKWLAMFPEGMEAWSEFRRTGYPKIFPVVKNYSGGTIDTEKQIRRLPFPQTEYDNNNENVKNAISLLNGADHGGTPLWWDKK